LQSSITLLFRVVVFILVVIIAIVTAETSTLVVGTAM